MRSLERQKQFDIAYMQMAMAMGNLSYALRKKVGAIIVSKNDQVISQGINGTPTGFNNICEEYETPDGIIKNYDDNPNELIKINDALNNKYRPGNFGKLITKPCVLHAEANAIIKCAKFNSSTQDSTLYVTLSPCIECAKLIIQAEIKRVVYYEVYRNIDGINFLEKCGIKVEKIDLNNI